MIIKKIISSILAVAMVAAMSTTVFAEDGEIPANETNSKSTASTEQFSVNRSQLSPEQQQQLDDQMDKMLSGETKQLEVGEKTEIGKTGEDTIYIELVERQNTPQTRSGDAYSYETYLITYKNIFDIETKAFQMALECRWYSNGQDSYIKTLIGTYTVLSSSVICEWGSGSTSSPIYHALEMSSTCNGVSTNYMFGAFCEIIATPPRVSFICTPY